MRKVAHMMIGEVSSERRDDTFYGLGRKKPRLDFQRSVMVHNVKGSVKGH